MQSDVDGAFTFKDLDAELVFKLLAVAPGYVPRFEPGVDPSEEDVRFELQRRRESDLVDALHGRVVDHEGKPVLGASVSALAKVAGTRTQFGGLAELDPLAITNEKGDFVLSGTSKEFTYHLYVKARALAPAVFANQSPEKKVHLKLEAGITLAGRLLHEGEPLAGVQVGAIPVMMDRYNEKYAEEQLTFSDDEGRFTFLNALPGRQLTLYGKWESLRERNLTFVPRRIKTGKSGEETDTGVWNAIEGLRLSGFVELADGGRWPTKRLLILSPEDEWGAQVAELDRDGFFEFTGLWPGQYSLTPQVNGYRFSPDNWSVDPSSHASLTGRVQESREDLHILLERGAMHDYRMPAEDVMREFFRRREQPLQGVEGD